MAPGPRTRRRVDWIFSLGVLLVSLGLAGGVWLLRDFQVQRNVAALHDQARRLHAEGQFERAVDDLRLYLRYRPDDPQAWADLARWSDQADRDGRQALSVFYLYREALRRLPEDRQLRRRAIDLAFEINRPGDAAELLDPWLASDPNQPELQILKARALAAQGQPAQAEPILRALIESEPARVSAYLGLAELWAGALARSDEVAPLLDRMVEANPQDPAARVARWRFFRSRPELGRQADPQDISEALRLAPENVEALRAAAEIDLEQNRLDEARARLETASRLAPHDPATAAARAALALRDNQPQDALAQLDQAIQANPRDRDLPLTRLNLLIDLGQIDGATGARARLDALRRRGLHSALTDFFEGRIAAARGRWGDALRRLAAAADLLQLDPVYGPQVDRALLLCQEQLGLRLESLATRERMARRPNADVATRLALAEAYTREGRLDQATLVHRSLLPVRPESRLDLIRLETLTQARKPPGERRPNQLLSLLAEAEAALPPSPELTLRRAAAQNALGQHSAARSTLEAGLTRFPDSRMIRIAFAQTLATDQPDQARALLDQAPDRLDPEIVLARLALDLQRADPSARTTLAQLQSQLDDYPAQARLTVLEGLAWACLRLGDLNAARDHLARRVSLSDSITLRQTLVDLELQLGQAQAAQAHVQALRGLEGESGTGWRYAQARIALDARARGHSQAAQQVRDIAREITERRPDSWIPPTLHARLAELERRSDDAIPLYQRALQLGADSPEIARRLAALLFRAQRFTEIDQLVSDLNARGQVPDDLRLLSALNALRYEQVDAGLTQIRQLLPESSRDPFELLFLARVLAYAGRLADAERPLRRAVELAPREPETHLALIEVLVQLERTDQARQQLQFLEAALDPADLPLAQARAFDLLGEADRATQLFDTALAARPRHVPTLRAAAASALRQRRYDRAQSLLNSLLDPASQAPPEAVQWARRSQSMLEVRFGSLEQIDSALQTIEASLQANPANLDDRRLRALLLAMRPSRRQEAIAELETLEAARLLSDDERFLLAMLHGSNRDLDRCEAQMKRLLASPRRTPAHLAFMVILQLDRQRPAEARSWLDTLRQTEPDSPRTLELECRLLALENNRDALRRRLLDHARSKPDSLPAVAVLLERYGFLDAAEAGFRQFAASIPARPEQVLPLVEFLGRHSRVAEALDLAEPLRSSLPAPMLLSVVVPLVLNGQASEADRLRVESWLDAALAASPTDPVLRLKRANLRLYQGRIEEARSLYSEILASAPDDLEALNNLAWQLAFQKDQSAEALRLINRALEIYGHLPALLDTRAVIQLHQGQLEAALRDLQDALAAHPDQPLLYFHLAWVQHAAGNTDDARQSWQRARELGLTAETTDPLERANFQRLVVELSDR
ncbi:MAG: hypothetical protein KatS3mg108_2048 [Isosphaeraceae bacterium]|jgi:tetratricopeptide (TPR) repeat protein|nr:MAG: hypothetical protein KatS3mg108_2048 [Isosphaeraceae bacterium]